MFHSEHWQAEVTLCRVGLFGCSSFQWNRYHGWFLPYARVSQLEVVPSWILRFILFGNVVSGLDVSSQSCLWCLSQVFTLAAFCAKDLNHSCCVPVQCLFIFFLLCFLMRPSTIFCHSCDHLSHVHVCVVESITIFHILWDILFLKCVPCFIFQTSCVMTLLQL